MTGQVFPTLHSTAVIVIFLNRSIVMVRAITMRNFNRIDILHFEILIIALTNKMAPNG